MQSFAFHRKLARCVFPWDHIRNPQHNVDNTKYYGKAAKDKVENHLKDYKRKHPVEVVVKKVYLKAELCAEMGRHKFNVLMVRLLL